MFESKDKTLMKRWSHHDRLRYMYVVLTTLGRQKGVKKIHKELEEWAKATGNAQHVYHVTQVYFWLQMIDYCLALDKNKLPPASKVDQNNGNAKKPKSIDEETDACVMFFNRHNMLLDSYLHQQY